MAFYIIIVIKVKVKSFFLVPVLRHLHYEDLSIMLQQKMCEIVDGTDSCEGHRHAV